ncbi:MAG: hypothetical protein HWD82_06585 [Flavobacteriaceae bacterium]|nr:hypothetical protein [Flavobacteriaceae bacterium]
MNKLIYTNDALNYGDRHLALIKNYQNLENKLIIHKKISSEVELQIGKIILPFIKKINKTELDKALQNSLNVLAVNF